MTFGTHQLFVGIYLKYTNKHSLYFSSKNVQHTQLPYLSNF